MSTALPWDEYLLADVRKKPLRDNKKFIAKKYIKPIDAFSLQDTIQKRLPTRSTSYKDKKLKRVGSGIDKN